MKIVNLLLTVAVAAGTLAGSAATNEWPFAILRSYGSFAGNPRFTARLFAAQERHPGLIEEVWFGGGCKGNFCSPEEYAEGVTREVLPARERCRQLGIAFSYQQGVTLNHAPDDADHPGFPDDCWVVDREGRRRKGLFCCTSPFTIDYTFRKASAILGALQPDAYWPDDDVRLFKQDWSKPCICFCPRCLDRFSKKYGQTFDRKGLLAALEGPKASAEVRRAWCAFNGEVLGEYARTFRRAVDAASPQTRLGMQIALSDNTYDGESWKTVVEAFAGPGGKAGIRPGGLHYTDREMRGDLLLKLVLVAREAARTGRLSACGQVCYEVENWPHIGANKNPNAMMAECALALAVGCDSLALYWGADQNTQDDAAYDYWFDCVARWKPFCRAVRDGFRGTALGGVAVFHGSDFFKTDGWLSHNDYDILRLSENAVPITVAEAAPDVWFLNPRSVETMSEKDLPTVFSKPVLIDVATFSALKERFPSLAFTKKVSVQPLEGERALATVVRQAGYEVFPSGLKAESVRAKLCPAAADVRAFSSLTVDPKAAGTVLVPTEFGGAVVLTQHTSFGHAQQFWPDGRRNAVMDALDAAVPGGMSVRLLTDGYSVAVFCRKHPDGSPAGAVLFNLGAGETPPLELAIRRGAGKNWRVMLPNRGEVAAEQRQHGSETILRLPPLRAYEPALVR